MDEQGKEISPAKKIAAEHREIPKQCELHKMPADGACFFHAVAKGLHWLSGPKKAEYCHRQLRARVAAHLKKYASEYIQEWDGLGPSLEKMREEAAAPQEAFERYLAAIAGESAYASELEARAISRIFNCCLCVIPQDGRFAPMLFRESQRSRSIVLWYTSKHIDLLLPSGDATAYHDDLFLPSPGFVEATKAKGRARVVKWCADGFAKCRLCPWSRPCTDPAKAKELLRGHFRTLHKGQTPSGLTPMNCQLPSLVSCLQDGPAWWKCPLCSMGIPYEAGARAGAPRVARDQMLHKSSRHPRVTWVKWRKAMYGQRADKTRQTKYRARTAFNLQCKPHLLARFEPFRWPRPRGDDQQQAVKFVKAWVCLKCHAPFEQDKGAEEHVPSKCPTTLSPKRLPGLVKRCVCLPPSGPSLRLARRLAPTANRALLRLSKPPPSLPGPRRRVSEGGNGERRACRHLHP